MADAVHSLCASPAFKRPRLDSGPESGCSRMHYEPSSCEAKFRDDCEPQNGVSSSTDTQIDTNGDSGFHERSPTLNSVDSVFPPGLSDKSDLQQYIGNEPDSSGIALEGPFVGIESCPPDSDENDDDVASTISDLSGFSDCIGPNANIAAPYLYVQRLMESGTNPRDVLMEMLPSDTMVPNNLSSSLLWRLVLAAFQEPPPRKKLPQINTMENAISLLRACRKVIVLTGAGVSVSCGIPDFRSRNGVYARLSQDYPDLPDPSAMFDITYFKKDPRPFFKFAKEIYPGQFRPSPSHHFIKLLENQGKLLRNYTQNIDTLEHAAGIQKVITCHGSFATASCTVCRYKVDSSEIKEDIFNQRIPYCNRCSSEIEKGIMKPDIVFFGEGLSDEFHESMDLDKNECDLLIVMGSSLKVRPVATIPSHLPPDVPQILINREPLNHLNFDIELLGDCDVVINEICQRLSKEWNIENVDNIAGLTELTTLPSPTTPVTSNTTVPLESTQDSNSSCRDVGMSTKDVASDDNATVSSSTRPNGLGTPPLEEESNSCDCRGLSAIRLEDSQDSSSLSQPTFAEPEKQPSSLPQFGSRTLTYSRESISSLLPENTYLFVPPNRYIFQGAEVYQNNNNTEPCTTIPTQRLNALASDVFSLSSSSSEDDEGTGNPNQCVQIDSQSPEGDASSLSEEQSPAASPSNNVSLNNSSSSDDKERS